jgi:hypothetical protein
VFSLNSIDSFPTIYKFLGAKFNPPVRAAALRFFERLVSYMIDANLSNKEIFLIHIHKLANSVFSAIADESSQVQRPLWKSVLMKIFNHFEGVIWQQIDIKKGLLPQIHTSLKNAGFGSHSDLYKYFVAIVAKMPIFDFSEPLETVCKIEQSGSKKAPQPKEEIKEVKEVEETDVSKKGKKKQNKPKGQGNEGSEKVIKNSFSISDKANVMYDVMKSLFSGINMEEAIAFSGEIVD